MDDSSRSRRLAAAAVILFMTAGGQAFAGSLPVPTSAMSTGGITSQPIGHYDMCNRRPGDCVIRPIDRGPMPVDDVAWQRIETINRKVNEKIAPRSDAQIYGQEEWWTYPTNGEGDCEDYVLEKRRLLASAGISLSNLLITVVRKPDGEGHAVLTVRTERGDFVLDNLDERVRAWHETGYSYLKRQASDHTGRWVTLRDEQNMLVSAVE